MPDDPIQEMALSFAQMSKSKALNRLYAAKVKREGKILLSKLLYSIARSEEIHARRILMYLRHKIGDPSEYLEDLLHAKHKNASIKYPEISDRLIEAGKKKAGEAFDLFSKVEKIHRKLLEEVLKKNTEDSTNYYVCQICGYVSANEIPTNCPVCNAIQEKFRLEY